MGVRVPPGFPLPRHLQGPSSPSGWTPASLPRSSLSPQAPAALPPKRPVCTRSRGQVREELGGWGGRVPSPSAQAVRRRDSTRVDWRCPPPGRTESWNSDRRGFWGSQEPPAARKRPGNQGQGPAGLTPAPPPWVVLLQIEGQRLPGLLPSEDPQVGRKAHWLPGSTSRALPPQQVGAQGRGDLSPPLRHFPTSRVPAVKTTAEACGGSGGSERTGVPGDLLSPD